LLPRRTFCVLFQPKHDAEAISMARDYLTVIMLMEQLDYSLLFRWSIKADW